MLYSDILIGVIIMLDEYVIKSNNINKKFGSFELNLENFRIRKGLATALVGENGAGKSTLLNILSGIRRDFKGDLTYFDKYKNIEEKGLRDLIGYTGTGMYFIPSWTGNQIRELSKLMYKDYDDEKFMNIARSLDLDYDIFAKPAKPNSKLSDGNKVKLQLACVFARNTKLLIMDEPASPLDPLMRDALSEMIRKYIKLGNGERTVFFSTHNISDMENVTDYIMIMEKGKIVEEGYSKDMKEKYRFIKGREEDYEKVLPSTLNAVRTNEGFEGVILSDRVNEISSLNIVIQTPTLYQISVAIMKGQSKIIIPDF